MYARIHGKVAGRTSEDEATSCIFGPLRMLGAMEPGKTWAACLHLFQCGHLFPEDFEPTDLDVRFWPRFPPGRRGYVEPDVHVIARGGADVRTILIEVKRGAGLGQDQLFQQWERIQLPAEAQAPVPEGDELRYRSAHVLLGYVRPQHRADIDNQEARAHAAGVAWGGRLVTVTWGQFAAQLETLPVAGPLRADALGFLRKALHVVAVAPFEGIELAGLVAVSGNALFRDSDGVRLASPR